MSSWHDVLSSWHYVIVTLCHRDTMSSWHYVIVTLCHHDTMSSWHYVIVSEQRTRWQSCCSFLRFCHHVAYSKFCLSRSRSRAVNWSLSCELGDNLAVRFFDSVMMLLTQSFVCHHLVLGLWTDLWAANSVTILLFVSSILSWWSWHRDTMSSWHYVIVTLCHRDTMSSWQYVIVLRS